MPEHANMAGPGPFQSYEDVLRHLDGLGLFHMDMGLDRMRRALEALNLDDLEFPIVQVVGTNGKGSTATFLQSIAMAHGMRAGLYTSPHFIDPAERIRMDDKKLPRQAWPRLAARATGAEPGLTYFELLTVMAADAFKSSSPDLAIFEAGLGARHDATTALPAEMVCFTPIDMDHANILGESIYDIAADKADALRPGVAMAVSAPQEPIPMAILANKAEDQGIPFCTTDSMKKAGSSAGKLLWEVLPKELERCARIPGDATLGLRGAHQRINALTAVQAWILLCMRHGWKTNSQSIARGLEKAFIPGRLQFAPAASGLPALWLDGAHNAHGMAALCAALEAMDEQERPGAAVFSCLRDKDPQALAARLQKTLGKTPVFVPTISGNPRAAQGEEIAALLGPAARPTQGTKAALDAAAEAAGGRPVLVCGSLYLLSEVYRLHPALLETPPADAGSRPGGAAGIYGMHAQDH